MFSPIARSAQRISIRNWAHSSSSTLTSLQVDALTLNNKKCSPPQSRKITSTFRNASSVASESPAKVPAVLESHLAFTNLQEEQSSEDFFQETRKIPIYHHFPKPPTSETDLQSRWAQAKREKALKKFAAAEKSLSEKDPESCKLFRAIKAPLLELERYRASALIDIEACGTLISHLGDIQDPTTAVVVGNPGAGIFSKELLRQGAKRLFLFECNPEIRAHLQKIHKDDPVFISQHYFFGSALKEHNTKHHICKLLESDEVTNLKIVQSLTNPLQARDFLLNYTTGQIPYDKKNVEIFLITQRNYGEKLAALGEREQHLQKVKFASSWRTFMNTEWVCTLPTDSFFPVFEPLGFGVRGNTKKDPKAVLLRCTFRQLFCGGRPLSLEERHLFDIFIRHMMISPSSQVPHALEKWVPGIGIRLVRQGISLFARFNQLSKEEFERIFFIFLEHAPVNSPVWLMMGANHPKTDESL